MIDIPKQVAVVNNEADSLPQIVAEITQEQAAPETTPYVISFARYNEKMCEISLLSGNKGKKVVEILKAIGTKACSESDFRKYNVDRLPVRNDGDYKRLYNGLKDDIDLKEIKLQQDGRIFYFDIEPERTLYVVAITENHLETKKVRRG